MNDDERMQGIAIYILYLIALFTGVPFLIGVILAYIFRGGGSPGMQTHYEHQIGLFWRFVFGNIIMCVIIGIGAVLTYTVLLAIVGIPMMLIGALGALWLWIMMLIRCIKGIGRLNTGEPYMIPAGWGF